MKVSRKGIFAEDLDVPATALAIISSLEGVLIQIFVLKADQEQLDGHFIKVLKKNIIYGILKRTP